MKIIKDIVDWTLKQFKYEERSLKEFLRHLPVEFLAYPEIVNMIRKVANKGNKG